MEKLDNKYIKSLRVLMETEVEQAEVLIAAKTFAQAMQKMIEKVGRLQNEDLGPVVDQMRETYGNEIADAFNEQLGTALQGVLDNMKDTQIEMNNAVNNIAQGKAPTDMPVDMDAGFEGGMEDDMGMGDNDMTMAGDEMAGDEFDDMEAPDEVDGLDDIEAELAGGDEAAAGPVDNPLGRAQKESIKKLANQLAEAKRELTRLRKAVNAKK